jgi:glycerol uptake facilitator-like aquaporin
MFIFIYASTCSKMNTGVDLAFFVGILMAIPICAKQTGANLNPAVSYSMVLKNDAPSTYSIMWIYFKAQVLGAIISMVLATSLNDVYRSPLYPNDFTTGEVLRMILSEAIGVFALIFFVLYATGPISFIEENSAKYFYIAVFVYIGRRFAAVSGNQINFALTISQAFVGIPQCDYQGFKYLFIWFIGDGLGVLAAAKFYSGIL